MQRPAHPEADGALTLTLKGGLRVQINRKLRRGIRRERAVAEFAPVIPAPAEGVADGGDAADPTLKIYVAVNVGKIPPCS